jgi:hypothetical protein
MESARAPLEQEIHLQQIAVFHARKPVKFGDFRAVKSHAIQLRKHRFGTGAADVVFDQRDFDENVVGMAQDGFPAAKDIQLRALGVDLYEIEPPALEQIIEPDLVDLPFYNHVVPEEGRVLAIKRTACRLQPLLCQE